MKKLLLMMCFSIGLMAFGYAQSETTAVTMEDYERLVENTLQMEFRNFILEELNLTREEILVFDPILREYMEKRADKVQKKFELLEAYSDEMAEDDRPEDEKDESIDFVENYWEVEIDEIELKKRYFEKIAEPLSIAKAVEFFLVEEMIETRMKQRILGRSIPVIIKIEELPKIRESNTYKKDTKWEKDKKAYSHMEKPTKDGKEAIGVSKKYYTAIGEYDTWVTTSGRAVDISHDYTHNGLTKLTKAVYTVAKAYNIENDLLKNQKQEVIGIADELRKDPMKTHHADITRKAFMTITDMMETISSDSKFTASINNLNELEAVAKKMNPDKLMTDQASVIYDYFEKAQEIVNDISSQVNWADTKNKGYQNK